jgi:hypothetical protein
MAAASIAPEPVAPEPFAPERRVAELGLVVPDYSDPPYGQRYGVMKAYHRTGRIVTLSGITPEDRAGTKVFPGVVGVDVTVEQGYAAARAAAVNVLGLIRYAVGSLDEVSGFVNTQCYVAVGGGFTDVNLVSNGAADLFLAVFGDPVGRSTSIGLGISALSGNNCFEMIATVETRSAP